MPLAFFCRICRIFAVAAFAVHPAGGFPASIRFPSPDLHKTTSFPGIQASPRTTAVFSVGPMHQAALGNGNGSLRIGKRGQRIGAAGPKLRRRRASFGRHDLCGDQAGAAFGTTSRLRFAQTLQVALPIEEFGFLLRPLTEVFAAFSADVFFFRMVQAVVACPLLARLGDVPQQALDEVLRGEGEFFPFVVPVVGVAEDDFLFGVLFRVFFDLSVVHRTSLHVVGQVGDHAFCRARSVRGCARSI